MKVYDGVSDGLGHASVFVTTTDDTRAPLKHHPRHRLTSDEIDAWVREHRRQPA